MARAWAATGSWARVRSRRDSSFRRSPARCSPRPDTSATRMRRRRGGRWAGWRMNTIPFFLLSNLITVLHQIDVLTGSVSSFPLCPEVSHRQGLLHRQGAVDHGADLPQRPSGGHRGEDSGTRPIRAALTECKHVPLLKLLEFLNMHSH